MNPKGIHPESIGEGSALAKGAMSSPWSFHLVPCFDDSIMCGSRDNIGARTLMSVYVLGAGASRGAGYPLANELGNSLLEWAEHPSANSELCVESIKELFERYGDLANLEQILTDLDDCPPGSPVESLSRERRGRLRTYIRVAIGELFRSLRQGPAPSYERLAHDKARPGDVVITFNYDVACERELKRAALWEIGNGYGFSLNCSSIPPSQVSVLKLHGSANWLEGAFKGGRGFFQSSGNPLGLRPIISRSEFEFFGYPDGSLDSEAPGGSFGALPAMILPTLNKRFYEQTSVGRELESFWEDLWAQAKWALKSAERIVMIGYRMAAADEKARNLLLNTPNRHTRIEIFCGGATEAISEEFIARSYSDVHTFGNRLFEDYLCGF